MAIRRSTLIVWAVVAAYAALAVVAGVAAKEETSTPASFAAAATAACDRAVREIETQAEKSVGALEESVEGGFDADALASTLLERSRDAMRPMLRMFEELGELVPPSETDVGASEWRSGVGEMLRAVDESNRRLEDLVDAFPEVMAALEAAAARMPKNRPPRLGPDGRQLGPTAASLADAAEVPEFREYMRDLQAADPGQAVTDAYIGLLARAGLGADSSCGRIVENTVP